MHAPLSVESGEVVPDGSGLTSTGDTDVKHTLVNIPVHIDEVVLPGSLSSGDNQVAEELAEVSDKWLDVLSPRLKLERSRAEVVVEDHTAFRELDLGHGANLTVKGDSVLREGGTEGPHEGEGEETLVDDLQLLVVLLRDLFQALN